MLPVDKKILKGFIPAFVLFVCLCSSAFAQNFMGPPVVQLEPDQFSIDAEYSSISRDFTFLDDKTTLYLNGEYYSSEELGGEFDIEDFDVTNIGARFAYCIDFGWEVFFRLSGVKAQFDDDTLGTDFDSGYVPSLGAGLKMNLYDNYDFKIGILTQASWAKYSSKMTAVEAYPPSTVEIQLLDIQVALGASYMLTENINLYGGPLYHRLFGDCQYIYDFDLEPYGLGTREVDWDIESNNNYGGFAGIEYIINKDCSLNFEYQQMPEAQGYGISFVAKY